jgi:GPH family glycoside/pentoside/hexuronide:cation symporter
MTAMAPTMRQTLAYGALGLPLAMAALPMYVYLPQLYAQAGGMSLGLLGALLLGARVADAGIDPLLGAWADRARRRPPLVALALPFLAAGLFGLMHPPASGAAAWLLLFMLPTFFGFSLATVAYQAWGAEAGGDAAGRTRLTASREGFGLLGVLLAAVLPGLLSAELGRGLSLLAWIYPPLLAAAAWLCWRGAPAAPATARPVAAIGLMHAWRNPCFTRLLALFAVNGIAAALPATLVLFFVADVLQAPAWGGAFLALYFLAGVLCLPLWVGLARRIGRMRAWAAGMLLACAAFTGAYGLGGGDGWPFALVCLLSGAALGADLALPSALLADIAEGDGGDAVHAGAGACFGWWNLVAKLNLALAAGMALPLLAWLGYRPGSVDDAARGALSAVYCLLPLALKLLAAALCWRWRFQLEQTMGNET